MIRNIGIDIKQPKKEPSENEKNNPFNGSLSVRGKIFEGIIIKTKGKKTVVVQKESPIYFTKFRRYGRSKNRIHAHVPSNIIVEEGDHVMAAECRPISKSVSYVIIEVKK